MLDEPTLREVNFPSTADTFSMGDAAERIRAHTGGRQPLIVNISNGASWNDVPPDYNDYIRRIMEVINPDILCYDCYPFKKGGPKFIGDYFPSMKLVRDAALLWNVPYWCCIQSINDISGLRYPSDSELRMNVFTHLALGFTGLRYFMFCTDLNHDGSDNHPDALVARDRRVEPYRFVEKPLFRTAKAVNREASNIGRALRNLFSLDAYWIPRKRGRDNENDTRLQEVTGLKGFKQESGAALIDKQGSADFKRATTDGREKGDHGILGAFRDQEGRDLYLLPVNLNCGEGNSASSEMQAIRLYFGGDAKVFRLCRENAKVERLPLTVRPTADDETEAELVLGNIPGGTGDLLKVSFEDDPTFPVDD